MVPKLLMAMLAWVDLTLSGSAMSAPLAVSGPSSGFFPAFAAGFLLILGSEIGDKTFFIAAILSMKNSHVVVFAGAISALIVMTVLSTGLGMFSNSSLPRFLRRSASPDRVEQGNYSLCVYPAVRILRFPLVVRCLYI